MLMQTYNEFITTNFKFILPPILVITYIFSRKLDLEKLRQTFSNLADSCLAVLLMTTAQKQI